MSNTPPSNELYRQDGVRITHDPYAPGMAEKYGMPGSTDSEGFDPYQDTVGPGIYGGIVRRHPHSNNVLIGKQYQNHNPRPGPIYAGGGYAPIARALDDIPQKLIPLLDKYPDLVNDITTGGAQPLHMCGMSSSKQHSVATLIHRGADVEALDTYGMTPLHRMASNNLAHGARMLLNMGASIDYVGDVGISPTQIAKESAAHSVLQVFHEARSSSIKEMGVGTKTNIVKLNFMGSPIVPEINGDYLPQDPSSSSSIPSGFIQVCHQNSWNAHDTWAKLNGLDPKRDIWFRHSENESYVYWNRLDGNWWVDGPDGNGVWIAKGPSHAPPSHGWKLVGETIDKDSEMALPMMRTFRTSLE